MLRRDIEKAGTTRRHHWLRDLQLPAEAGGHHPPCVRSGGPPRDGAVQAGHPQAGWGQLSNGPEPNPARGGLRWAAGLKPGLSTDLDPNRLHPVPDLDIHDLGLCLRFDDAQASVPLEMRLGDLPEVRHALSAQVLPEIVLRHV